MTKREYIGSLDDKEVARLLTNVAGYEDNKEGVDFWERWLKKNHKAESEVQNADSD